MDKISLKKLNIKKKYPIIKMMFNIFCRGTVWPQVPQPANQHLDIWETSQCQHCVLGWKPSLGLPLPFLILICDAPDLVLSRQGSVFLTMIRLLGLTSLLVC